MKHNLVPASELSPIRSYSWRELGRFVSPKALERIPGELARKYSVLPVAILECDPPALTLLTNRALGPEEARELRFVADAELIVEEIECEDFSLAIEAAYQSKIPYLPKLNSAQGGENTPIFESQEPVPMFLRFLLERAFSLNASDIHLEPDAERLSVRFRIDGVLREYDLPETDSKLGKSLSRRVKVLAGINLALVGVPTEGAFRFRFGPREIDVRVSTLPTIQGEKIVLRLHGIEQELTLSELGLSRSMYEQLLFSLSAESGAVLLSGPTGSGKTTLLYSALKFLLGSGRNIVTIEDPVEKRISGLSQTNIDHARGLDYTTLLKFVLRQDPDVIMLGEIRDRDTAETSLNAALTGHLVLSTVHATNVFDILTRLRQFTHDDDLLSKALRLLVSQRLVALNCGHCSKPVRIQGQYARFLDLPPSTVLSEPSGCAVCGETGSSGRAAVYEMLSVSRSICELIRSRASPEDLANEAHRLGYLPYRFQVRERLIRGEISLSTALKTLGA